ncbi:TauD/TfdA family dioxygenase [Spirosoma utsteinense]|uniref:Alpha-ketoglutarate-dependent taurine dioxygenase n=1 Tax=Spirosoma utsteinense TaxID=2585773 RepID=A0ABR6WEJ5_9BACT|nr:TauD/TfdA family dioxygenase [Spirosoma utsteinense]MBC3789200.1 alpha-ketoglutarate-dependent taurine dioxygenase [Spirosoma utsteinense]MBC3794946.1 alpha-ketoglutarate-dependent taurine dioxygenase [Spirosoma utsteinense]
MNAELIKKEVAQNGFYYAEKVKQEEVEGVVAELGKTLFITDIIERDNGRILNSATDMFLHTDQPDANYLVWHCLKQAAQGGETVLVNIEEAFTDLSADHQECLKQIKLRLSLLSPQELTHPFYESGRFFYSPSLLLDEYSKDQNEAVSAFQTALERVPKKTIRLRKNDFFALDNTRLMHGRKSFQSATGRHLKRYLIQADGIENTGSMSLP